MGNKKYVVQLQIPPFEALLCRPSPNCSLFPPQGVFTSHYGGSHYSQVAFYCGHSAVCDEFNGEGAMNLAKENVEKYFAVVGVLEQMDKSLEVLENYVPRFFRNAR